MSREGKVGLRGVIRSEAYRWFLLVYFLDELCTAIWLVTLGWSVTKTHSDVGAGVLLAINGVPLVVVLLTLSGWVDRHKSQTVAIWTLAARFVVFGAWLALCISGTTPLVLIAVIGGALGAISGLHDPAMITYPIALLPTDAQGAATTAERFAHRISQAGGGVLAGILLGWAGLGGPAAFAVVTLLLAAILLVRLKKRWPRGHQPLRAVQPAAGEPERTSASMEEGFQFVRAHGVLGTTLHLQAALTIAPSGVLLVLLPFRARAEHWTAHQVGGIVGALGIGMTIAMGLAMLLESQTSTRGQLLYSATSTVAGGAIVAAIGLVESSTADLALMVALGLAIGPAGPFLSGYLRAEAARGDRMRRTTISGRVTALMILATDALEPVAYILAIALSAVSSVTAAALILGGLCAASGLWCLWQLRLAPGLRGPISAQSPV